MRTPILVIAALLILLSTAPAAQAQVGIGTTTPDASAALDIASTTKGLLAPRMLEAERLALASPATGLLVFQTNQLTSPVGFYYNAGTPAAPSWQQIGTTTAADNLGNHTATQNLGLNNKWLSNNGTNTGLRLDNAGNLSVGGSSGGGARLSVEAPSFATAILRDSRTPASQVGAHLLLAAGPTGGAGSYFGGVLGYVHEDAFKAHRTAVLELRANGSGSNNGRFNLYTGSGAATLNSPQLTVLATGNVGLGLSTPDASAALDISSTSRGLLTPRMLEAERLAIASPATGLLVFQTDQAGTSAGFYYNAGTPAAPAWQQLGTTAAADNLGNHTATQALNMGAQALTGTGASIGTALGLGVTGKGGLNIGQNTGGNIALGYGSGAALTTGTDNQFSGYQAGNSTTSGDKNLFTGYRSGFLNTLGKHNQFEGYEAGYSNLDGENNQFSGYGSGYSNTTGSNNLFAGYLSGRANTTGHNNQFMGYLSGGFNTLGSDNLFIGYESGYQNLDGTENLFTGFMAGWNNTTGDGNLFSGYKSGLRNGNGNYNVFEGYKSGENNAGGSNNAFVGNQSGNFNTSGNNNTFSGTYSGNDNETGSNNSAFGFLAGPDAANLTNTTALGNRATVSQSNSLVLGGTGANAVKVGIGTAAPRGLLDAAGPGDSYLVQNPNSGSSQSLYLPGHLYLAPFSGASGTAFVQARVPNPVVGANGTDIGLTLRTTNDGGIVDALKLNANGSAVLAGSLTANGVFYASDRRLKQSIRPLDGALASVLALRGVRYTYRQDLPRPLPAGEQVGVIAQEVEKLYPELVSTGADGYKAVNYAQLTPVLLEAIKEQQTQIEALQQHLRGQQSRDAAQTADLQTLKYQMARLLGEASTSLTSGR